MGDSCYLKVQIEDRLVGELKADGIQEAESQILWIDQRNSFYLKYKLLKQNKSFQRNNTLLNLNPVIDEDGLLRREICKIRTVSDVRYPVILPRNNSTTFIVKHYHDKGKFITGSNRTQSTT